MCDVFISYSFANKAIADGICHFLEANGVRCWYAPRDIPHGMDYRAAIMEAIGKVRCFILVYTRDSNDSSDVLNEITAASKARIPILPFRVEDVPMKPEMAYYLNGVHWLDAISPPLKVNIRTLCQSTCSLLGKDFPDRDIDPDDPPPPPPPPEPWWKKLLNAFRRKKLLLPLVLIAVLVGAWQLRPGLEQNPEPSAAETTEAAVSQAPQTIRMVNLSELEQYRYPFYGNSMFSGEMDQYFVENKETGDLSLAKTDTGYTIATGISYDPKLYDCTWVCLTENYTVAYFFAVNEQEYTIRSFDKRNNVWLCEEGVSFTLSETEELQSALYNFTYMTSGGDHLNELVLLIYDWASGQECITQAITLYPDGTLQKKDISAYGFTQFLMGIDKPGYHRVIMLDKNHALQLLDIVTLEPVPASYEEIRTEYIPYAVPDNRIHSQNGRYLRLVEPGAEGSAEISVWDLWEQKCSYKESFTQNHMTYFCGDSKLLIFNQEDCSLWIRNLETGRQELLMDKTFFRNTEEFLDAPYAFFYEDELDACFFVTAGYAEDGDTWVNQLVMTDLEGNVLARSTDLKLSDEDSYIDLQVESDMLFFMEYAVDPTEELAEGISTVIYRARFSVNDEGIVRFLED